MKKAVSFTIFVLSALILLGISSGSAFATEKSSPNSLNNPLSLIKISEKPTPISFQLYSPLQENFFQKVNPTIALLESNDSTAAFISEIGESEVDDLPQVTPTPSLVTPTALASSESDTFKDTLNADTIYSLVNSARTNAGLPPFQREAGVCSVAESRGPELYNEIMVTHTMHAGFYARNLPYWATENVIHMRSEQAAVNWWMNSPVHRSAILGDYKFACGTCVGRACNMIFTNLTPKETLSPAPLAVTTPTASSN